MMHVITALFASVVVLHGTAAELGSFASSLGQQRVATTVIATQSPSAHPSSTNIDDGITNPFTNSSARSPAATSYDEDVRSSKTLASPSSETGNTPSAFSGVNISEPTGTSRPESPSTGRDESRDSTVVHDSRFTVLPSEFVSTATAKRSTDNDSSTSTNMVSEYSDAQNTTGVTGTSSMTSTNVSVNSKAGDVVTKRTPDTGNSTSNNMVSDYSGAPNANEVTGTSTMTLNNVNNVSVNTSAGHSVTRTSSAQSALSSSITPSIQFTQDNTSKETFQVSSSIPPEAGDSSVKTPSSPDIASSSTLIQNPASSTENTNANTTLSESSQSVIYNVSNARATIAVNTSSVTEASRDRQTAAGLNSSSAGPTEGSSETLLRTTSHRPNFTKDNPGSLITQSRGPSSQPSSAEASSVELSSSAQSGPTSPLPGLRSSPSSERSTSATVMSGSSERPSGASEGQGRRNVTKTLTSAGSRPGLSAGQRTAIGVCLTMVSTALMFAGIVLYRRRSQVGRWKLLDKSLRYRYWSYTGNCQQDDEIL